MVDPVGAKPSAQVARPLVVAEVPGFVVTPRAASVVQTGSASAGSLGALVQSLAAAPPVDSERVSRIRQAIETNTYPIAAETIADRLIALRPNRSRHEQA